MQNSGALTYIIENSTKNAIDISGSLALFYYSHIFLELVMCVEGNVMGINAILFHEGVAEIVGDQKDSDEQNFKAYGSKEIRIKQHHSFLDILLDFPLFYKDSIILSSLYRKLCAKTFHLVGMVAMNKYYKQAGYNKEEIIKEVYDECAKGLRRIYPNKNDKNYYKDLSLLDYLADYCKHQV